jgi:archaeal flagellar protein FlaJ
MIDELKRNTETEIGMLREISAYSRRMDFATPSEAKLLKKSIDSLRASIKLINRSVPRLLQDVTLAKKLPAKPKKTGLESIGFQRSESRVNVTLQIKDRENFLKSLSLNETLIRRLKKSELSSKEEVFEEFKAARGYLKLSNKLFANQARKLIGNGNFKGLAMEISKANIDVLFQTYVAMVLFTSFLSIFVGILVAAFFLFFSLGISLPFVSLYGGSYLIRFFQIFWIPFVLPVVVFWGLYFYPSTERKTLAKKIDQELPFAVIHMSAISGSGIAPSEIFRIIGLSKEYPHLRREIRKVLNQINLYGYDLVTAVTNVAKSTSSSKLSELFSGLATTINSGGDLKEFFEKRSETLLMSYRLEREKYTRVAETFMDIYISVVIAAPMILMLLLVMIAVSGIEVGFSLGAMTFLIIAIIALINVIFIGFLNMKQPTY